MKQSTRMRMFLEYKNHPLREEYLKKKEKLMKKLKLLWKMGVIINVS